MQLGTNIAFRVVFGVFTKGSIKKKSNSKLEPKSNPQACSVEKIEVKKRNYKSDVIELPSKKGSIKAENNINALKNSGTSHKGGTKGTGKPVFKSEDLLDSHYQKHVVDQGEFGNNTKDQYLKGAQDLVTSKPGGDILTKTRTNGDTIFYNKATNEFAVTDKSGSIKTYFKPTDGIDYYNGQK
ncbi:hypothetical protein [Clostridium polynesiense]|uniref:hypothetical protein n=1 Tax=Clostridium polynesiense TaxID=1325933 RepID=UPI000A46094C|nr:hypothetical protein [Clostridium polynesiense]